MIKKLQKVKKWHKSTLKGHWLIRSLEDRTRTLFDEWEIARNKKRRLTDKTNWAIDLNTDHKTEDLLTAFGAACATLKASVGIQPFDADYPTHTLRMPLNNWPIADGNKQGGYESILSNSKTIRDSFLFWPEKTWKERLLDRFIGLKLTKQFIRSSWIRLNFSKNFLSFLAKFISFRKGHRN